MSGLFDRAASLFERRFLLSAFLPVLLLVGAGTALTLSAVGQLDELSRAWDDADAAARILTITAALTITWFFAGVLASQYRTLTQMYEGYTLTRTAVGARIARRWADQHYARRERWLASDERSDDAFYAYPLGERRDFLPTALGNTLRSAEYYPNYRYNIPTTFLWPRLFYLAPEHFRHDVEEFRTDYEWLLGVSFVSAIVAVAAGAVQLLLAGPAWLFAITFGGGGLVAFLAYRGAVAAAQEYGDQLRAGVDLYRTDVLAQMRWGVPDTAEQERQIWDEVRRVHLRDEPRTRPYSALTLDTSSACPTRSPGEPS